MEGNITNFRDLKTGLENLPANRKEETLNSLVLEKFMFEWQNMGDEIHCI